MSVSSSDGSPFVMAKRGCCGDEEADMQELKSSRAAAAIGGAESLGERLARSPAMRVELEQILFTSYLLMSKLVTALVPLNFIAAMS